MSNNLGLAQEFAYSLATSLMTCVILFRSKGGYAVVPTAEFDGGRRQRDPRLRPVGVSGTPERTGGANSKFSNLPSVRHDPEMARSRLRPLDQANRPAQADHPDWSRAHAVNTLGQPDFVGAGAASPAGQTQRYVGHRAVGEAPIARHLADWDHAGCAIGTADDQIVARIVRTNDGRASARSYGADAVTRPGSACGRPAVQSVTSCRTLPSPRVEHLANCKLAGKRCPVLARRRRAMMPCRAERALRV